jgi:hypothetical protein
MTDDRPVVGQLFDAIGVKRVVYVDDRFGATKERLSALCLGLTSEAITASNAFPGVELTNDEDVRQERLRKAIDALDDQSLAGAFDAIGTATGIESDPQDRRAAVAFSEELNAVVDLKPLSGAQWQEQRGSIIAEVQQKPTLFIFDDDFRLEGGSAREGRRFVAELHAALPGYKFAYALLTHNASDEATESQLEKSIAEENPDIEDFVVVIAKTRLLGADRKVFAYRLKSTLLFRLFRTLRSKLKESATMAHDKAIAKINAFGVDAFERIVHRSSSVEGAWSPETLVRIFGVMHEREIRLRLRGDEALHEAILEIDPISRVETGGASDAVVHMAEELQHAEVYDAGREINSLHLPLESGDLFRADEGEQYLVAAQQCDLVVRDAGWRKNEGRDARQVIALLKVGTRSLEKKPSVRPNEFELPHFVTDGSKFVFGELNQVVYVPAWILDMAVLNSDGSCKISDSQQAAPLLTSPWRQRLPFLRCWAESVVATADRTPELRHNGGEEFLRSLLRFPLSTAFRVKIAPSDRRPRESWTLCVGLSRVGRLRERYATALIDNYANYWSRPAQPHDLTKSE